MLLRHSIARQHKKNKQRYDVFKNLEKTVSIRRQSEKFSTQYRHGVTIRKLAVYRGCLKLTYGVFFIEMDKLDYHDVIFVLDGISLTEILSIVHIIRYD